MRLGCGVVVKSIAGHDKDRFYVVVEMTKQRAYIADGKRRSLNSPKAKNFIHLKVTNEIIDLKEVGSDRKLRKILCKYNCD